MKNKIIAVLTSTLMLILLIQAVPVSVSAESFCFVSVGPNASNAPVACSTVKSAGSNPDIIGDNKCYKLGNDNKWAEVDCANPAQPIATTDLSTPVSVKNDCNGSNITGGLSENDPNHCGILDYILIATNLLSALVGVVVVAMIIVGGIQYSSAGDDPQKVAAAKSKITNAILALVVFFFMFALLQWLVPGGIF